MKQLSLGCLHHEIAKGSFPFWFGSAHVHNGHFVFCDGSIHSLSYSIDQSIFARLGNRKDGESFNTTAL